MTLGTLALAIWFLMYAIVTLTNVVVENQKFIMGILAAIVAICLFFGDRITRNVRTTTTV